MANAFMVQLPASAGQTLINGRDTFVVWATDSANALVKAKAVSDIDIDSVWTGATVTDLSAAPVDVEGWVFDVDVSGAATHAASYTAVAGDVVDDVGTALAAALNTEADLEGYEFTLAVTNVDSGTAMVYTAVAGDTIHDVCDALVLLLNAQTEIAAAAYVAATGVLTVAAAGDTLGDQTVTFTVADPLAADASASFVGVVTDGGAAGAALSAQMLNDGFIFSAAYNTGTNVLTIAGVLDGIGDADVAVTATLPAGAGGFGVGTTDADFFASLTDGGAAAAALSVVLVSSAHALFGAFKS